MFTSLHTSEGTVLGLHRTGAATGLIRQLLTAPAAPAPARRAADAPSAAARQAEPAWDAPAHWLR
ncbi:hypothetical protein [Ruixingdingia sedimenti]|uniref:Uncharacterized protein n=1 Tax=Ruixingdingia sedimenti TaxID=3073604 RepID=A0ABU1F5G6_9RHOB|nr:hypothetical protein [Xinfangfangia sp. LG-4]MDR5652079.1 hypothetical protein [Xinfangfangia sp. LG-4]